MISETYPLSSRDLWCLARRSHLTTLFKTEGDVASSYSSCGVTWHISRGEEGGEERREDDETGMK